MRNLLESYHDAQQALDTAMNLFGQRLPAARPAFGRREPLLGDLPEDRASSPSRLEFVPEELEGLEATLSDTYFCNFSLFQSMPDSWAIKQLFQSCRSTGSNERPTPQCRARRRDLRFRRQDRPVHRPSGREADAAAPSPGRASPTTSARS
jgi:arginine decarboxylase-like protein